MKFGVSWVQAGYKQYLKSLSVLWIHQQEEVSWLAVLFSS